MGDKKTSRQVELAKLNELDACLDHSESAIPGIKEKCEKKIVWHQGDRKQQDLAIVYLHGFSASRMETWPLCDRLAKAIGANLFYTRLTGHGQDGQAMAAATIQDWLEDATEAVQIGKKLGKKIILIGTSTGGTLATWLASQPKTAPLIHRLILISPNFLPKCPLSAITLWPMGVQTLEILFGSWRAFSVTNDLQAKYWTARYPFKALTPMMQLVWLSWRVDLKNAAMPALMLLNPQDRVISVSLAKTRFSNFPSKHNQLVLFRENKDIGRHVLAGQMMAPEGTAKAQRLIQAFIECIF
jgi:esterase/lipase